MGCGSSVSSKVEPQPKSAPLDETTDYSERHAEIQLPPSRRDAHHTAKFHAKELEIYRRGSEVALTILWVRDAQILSVKLRPHVTAETQNDVTKIDGTVIEAKACDDKANCAAGELSFYISKRVGDKTSVALVLPANFPVGHWEATIEAKAGATTTELVHPMVVLFNPWCPEDTVHMAEQGLLEEYILNDDGYIYVGSTRRISPRAWNFAQFNTKSLFCTFLLLKDLSLEERADPVIVARTLSAKMNVQDDNGVLVGNWSGKYEGGEKPTSWTGSAEILKQYWTTRKPVKYGQCWVFSGIVTTGLRALGIPGRSVTNFGSVHDTDMNRALDKYFDADGEPLEHLTHDSMWNFHVWNECWMRRPDLEPGYDGWQAVDATPQEASAGKYQTGPASLTAVKNGVKQDRFDVEFVVSEVNADINHYRKGADGEFKLYYKDTKSAGNFISTKRANANEREDVTHLYKHPEGTFEERAALGLNNAESATATDVSFAVDLDEDTPLGQDVQVSIVCTNESDEPRTVDGVIYIKAVAYDGRPMKEVARKHARELSIAPGEKESVTLSLAADDYREFLAEMTFFQLRFFAKVAETDQTASAVFPFALKYPEVTITVEESALRVDGTGKVRVRFHNPLPWDLDNVVVKLEGQGLTKVQVEKLGDIDAGEAVEASFPVQAVEEGEHLLIATVDADNLAAVTGFLDVQVKA